MLSRHLILLRYKGGYPIAQYGQYQGQPSGQGLRILDFVSSPVRVARLKASIDNRTLYTPSKQQIEMWENEVQDYQKDLYDRLKHARTRQQELEIAHISPTFDVCPSLSSTLSAGILPLVANAPEPVPILNDPGPDFVSNSILCEWAYVIDLDTSVFEVWSRDAPKGRSARFDELDSVRDQGSPGMVTVFRLDSLPQWEMFMRECEKGLLTEEEQEHAKKVREKYKRRRRRVLEAVFEWLDECEPPDEVRGMAIWLDLEKKVR